VNLVHNIIGTYNATLKDSAFGENAEFTVEIRASKYKEFKTKLKDATNGQVEIIKG
jgi:putative IMPACT (imprinted ancient) family translation regulator